MTGDGGSWIRRQCMTMAKNCHTPVDFWLRLPLRELGAWIRDNNEIIRESESKK